MKLADSPVDKVKSFADAMSIIRGCHRRNIETLEISADVPGVWTVAERVVSDLDIPAFANSSMDGFAVLSQQTQLATLQNPLQFPVEGSISAGDSPLSSHSQSVWEVMTGAAIPTGLDAVIKVEDVVVTRDERGQPIRIELKRPAIPGQFFRAIGSDIAKGATIVQPGTQLTPEVVLVLATLGITRIRVFRKPRVAVISTGKELVSAESESVLGQIRNSTAPFLRTALSQIGAESSFYQMASDNPDDFIKRMELILRDDPDVIISTGGVSMGKHDFIEAALADLGAHIRFHKIALRPGKPNLFAEFQKGPVFFGLPGNPVSTMVGMRFLVEPFLREFMGRPPEIPFRAQLDAEFISPEGLTCFLKAKFKRSDGLPEIRILPKQESYQVSSLLEANAWAKISESESGLLKGILPKGTTVDVYPLFSLSCDRSEDSPVHQKSWQSAQRGGCC